MSPPSQAGALAAFAARAILGPGWFRSWTGSEALGLGLAAGAMIAKYAGRGGDGLICTSGKAADLYTETLLPNVLEGIAASGQAKALLDWVARGGHLLVRTPEGLRFKLGTGLSDAQRNDPPPVGSWVTYRFRGLHESGLPRFASFMRVRPDAPPR